MQPTLNEYYSIKHKDILFELTNADPLRRSAFPEDFCWYSLYLVLRAVSKCIERLYVSTKGEQVCCLERMYTCIVYNSVVSLFRITGSPAKSRFFSFPLHKINTKHRCVVRSAWCVVRDQTLQGGSGTLSPVYDEASIPRGDKECRNLHHTMPF